MSVVHAAKARVAPPPARSRLSLLLGVAIPAASGAVMSFVMPRGPVRPIDVIASMLVGAVVGVVSGRLLGRWALLWAPVLFAGFFELTRLWQLAPSLDGIQFDSAVGVVIFATTRGFHLVVGILPMLAGVLVGSTARRRSFKQDLAPLPLIGTSLLVLVIAAGSFFISRPGRTEPIVGPDGRELAGSIAEVGRVEIGGHEQTVIIRGQDASNPILLYLTGGPGNSDFGYTRTFLEPLEEDFVIVAWDQRGAGTSYAAPGPGIDPHPRLGGLGCDRAE